MKLAIGAVLALIAIAFGHCSTFFGLAGYGGGYFNCWDETTWFYWVAIASGLLIAWGLWDLLETSEELDRVLQKWRKK